MLFFAKGYFNFNFLYICTLILTFYIMKRLLSGILVFLAAFFSCHSYAAYFSGEMEVDPLNGSLSMFPGTINVYWKDVTLKTGKINSSYVTVTVNGQPHRITNQDQISVVSTTESDEQFGGTNTWVVTPLRMNFSSLFFVFGEISITIKEGAVKDNNGDINPEFTLTFYQYEIDGLATFSPADGITCEEGSGMFYVSWSFGPARVNRNTPNPAFVDRFDLGGAVEKKLPIDHLMSEIDGKIAVDLSSLEPGAYSVTFPEGCVLIESGNNILINGENFYNFTITEAAFPEEVPEEEPDDQDQIFFFTLNPNLPINSPRP